MTEKDLLELKFALERLRDALLKAMHALDEVDEASRPEKSGYDAHGRPFGPSTAARRVWTAFGQNTTDN